MAALWCVVWGCKSEAPAKGPLVGKPAREIANRVEFWVGAREVELAACRGRAVLLFFWHPADGRRSLAALPHVAKLARGFADDGLLTVGLSVLTEGREPRETLAELRSLRKEHDLPFPLGADCDADLHQAYRIDELGTPYCYLVDKRGVVVWAGRPGELTAGLIRRWLP